MEAEAMKAVLREVQRLGLPAPTVELEDDWMLAFDWCETRDCTVSLSFYPDGQVGYSSLIGTSSAWGRHESGYVDVLTALKQHLERSGRP